MLQWMGWVLVGVCAEQEVTVQGQVVDLWGRPQARAQVWVWDEAKELSIEPFATFEADGDGRFRQRLRRTDARAGLLVWATGARDVASRMAMVRRPEVEVDVELVLDVQRPPPTAVSVLGPDGVTVREGTLAVVAGDGPVLDRREKGSRGLRWVEMGRRRWQAELNGPSPVALPPLPVDRFTVTARTAAWPGATVELETGTEELVLRLARGARHQLELWGPEGQPVERAEVVLHGVEGHKSGGIRTGNRWHWQGLSPVANALVSVRAEGLAFAVVDGIDLRDPAPRTVIHLRAERVLEGRVVDGGGAPIRGARILCRSRRVIDDPPAPRAGPSAPEDFSFPTIHSDAEGRFTLRHLDAVEVRVRALAPRGSAAIAEGRAEPGSPFLELVSGTGFLPDCARLVGRAPERWRGPVELTLHRRPWVWSPFWPSRVDLTVEPGERFEIAGLQPGAFDLLIRRPGGSFQAEVEAPGPGTHTVDLATLSGRGR